MEKTGEDKNEGILFMHNRKHGIGKRRKKVKEQPAVEKGKRPGE
jgi:hypothetical protein